MTFSISMFTGSEDLNHALQILACTCFALARDAKPLTLRQFHQHFCSAEGYQALLNTAERFEIALHKLPTRTELEQYFRDELLSRHALQHHAARNVYNTGKAILWQRLWLPFKPLLVPDDAYLQDLQTLCSFDSSANGNGKLDCVEWLAKYLENLGFDIHWYYHPKHAPILYARRTAQGLRGRIILYGHYDVVNANFDDWDTSPWELNIKANRFYACGIGDNKAALLSRLQALKTLSKSPELVWLIQGEEEIGSPFAHQQFPDLLRGQTATLWLEENGYHDLDGTQRILARTISEHEKNSLPPDRELWSLVDALSSNAQVWGIRHRIESRSLNKDFFPEGCPFDKQLPVKARYLAIGINDPASNIHHSNESVPVWTIPLHQYQLQTIFNWIDAVA